ncbi:MAG: glucose-phosphatase [Patescibacteria group bacterium]|nr:glucose-phosphatase [Patescibacteria group bacterium]
MLEVGQSQQKELARAIADARRAAGYTQQQLCTEAKLSYSTLAKIERGAIKTPSVFTVATIAAATGTTVEQLTGIAGANTPAKDYKTSVTGVKFVYFDINGVLVRFFQRAFAKIADDTGARPDIIEATFWHYNDVLCKGKLDIDDFNKIIAKKLHVNSFDWSKYYLSSIDPITEMSDCLNWVSQHYKIGLMSNIIDGFIAQMIKRKLLPDLPYDAIVDSSVEGYIKPEENIYKIAANKAGVLPEHILLIDDDRPNLMAAEHLGWRVLWFDDYQPSKSVDKIKKALEF